MTNKIQGTGAWECHYQEPAGLDGRKDFGGEREGKGSTFTVDLELELANRRRISVHVMGKIRGRKRKAGSRESCTDAYSRGEDNEINAEILGELLDMEGAYLRHFWKMDASWWSAFENPYRGGTKSC